MEVEISFTSAMYDSYIAEKFQNFFLLTKDRSCCMTNQALNIEPVEKNRVKFDFSPAYNLYHFLLYELKTKHRNINIYTHRHEESQ